MTDNHLDNEALGPEGSYYDHVKQQEEEKKRQKDDALFPLIIATTYLILGFIFHMWHPGWLIFFAIPLHYVKFNSWKEFFCFPVTVALIYLILGFFFHLWHPGWLIFLVIPFYHITNGK